MNKLINEKSPYLLQHAKNPVDWLAWGDEAFEKAKAEDKPIFLSIGYSTCHWCHVMAHESFEDSEVAEYLNAHFVSIKVDREERPDVDTVYMSACQAITGSGGWPLSAFLDNNKQPFFVGTYFPKESFKKLLQQIVNLWCNRRDELEKQSILITQSLQRKKEISGYTSLENVDVDAIKFLISNFDPKFGGFSHAPKFPTPHNLLFLINHYTIAENESCLDMCKATLKSMREGGIFDHVGGGFSRYSTDNMWLVPHFEKMLYDNALLLMTYSQMYKHTKDSFYLETANDIASYLLRDMSNPQGGFYTAEDADSDGEEGLFYVFSKHEIIEILTSDAREFCEMYNISEKGNFEGKNILNTIGNLIPDNRKQFFDACLKKLLKSRNLRTRPMRDEKILTSLNGLAIAAFAVAGRVLGRAEYTKVAESVVAFLNKNLMDSEGCLMSVYFGESGGSQSYAEDYAFYIWGLVELFKTTQDSKYLQKAIEIQKKFTEHFYDFENGGFYLSGKKSEKLIARSKELYDGAIPSYNSVAINNLLDIYNFTKDIQYMEQFVQTIKHFSSDIAYFSQGYIHSVSAILRLRHELPNIHICRDSACRPTAKTVDEFIKQFD